ncbi:MAG: radical SAM family heme chaperone HemW [Muribaculaceae bacterium]|nr:radical SAM family heme chaperone HemW [Muribaculaceae bacterium]
MAGLYIHVPFCHSKCAYCDFYSMPERGRDHGVVCRGLLDEYRMRANECGVPARWDTVYIGGGTPSILSPDELAPLLNIVVARASEVTIEVNPEDVKVENMSRWRELGVNRVSMGVQSFVDSELLAVGRRHDSRRAVKAFNVLRETGFENISLDLIYGLPGQTSETWLYSLDRMLKLSPEHFSAYCLSYEPGTRLYAAMTSGRLTPTDEDVLAEMYDNLHTRAVVAGYDHYEISNFAKPGYHSRHNTSYWESIPYLGLGPGAHSFDGHDRRYNPSNLKLWLETVGSGYIAARREDATDIERVNDVVFTRLRTARGLNPDELPAEYRQRFLAAIDTLSPGSLVTTPEGRLAIPHDRWLVSDAIIRDLLI